MLADDCCRLVFRCDWVRCDLFELPDAAPPVSMRSRLHMGFSLMRLMEAAGLKWMCRATPWQYVGIQAALGDVIAGVTVGHFQRLRRGRLSAYNLVIPMLERFSISGDLVGRVTVGRVKSEPFRSLASFFTIYRLRYVNRRGFLQVNRGIYPD